MCVYQCGCSPDKSNFRPARPNFLPGLARSGQDRPSQYNFLWKIFFARSIIFSCSKFTIVVKLDYWRDSPYANLKKITAAVFCILVSSAEPERNNSADRSFVKAKRNRLTPSTVKKLILPNEYYKK